jgi:nucleotide-binding universal stress UspA family protein
MMPQLLPTTILRGNSIISRIMIAIDDSEHSARALRYVGTLLRDTHDVHVTLFHVLIPMPRDLLEHGGSENPVEEVRLATELQQDQENWVREESVSEYPVLVKALELFGKTGFPLDRVTLKFGHEDNIAKNILEEARNGSFGTIVVTRHGSNGLKRFFGGGITDQLLREASGYTLWVVE